MPQPENPYWDAVFHPEYSELAEAFDEGVTAGMKAVIEWVDGHKTDWLPIGDTANWEEYKKQVLGE